MRHTGASADLTLNRRELGMVNRRGRWKHDRSLQRYLKGGRVAEQFNKLSRATQASCMRCHEATGRTLLGLCAPSRV